MRGECEKMAGRRQTTSEQDAAMWAGFLKGDSGSQIHREMQVNGLLTDPHPNVTVRLVQSRLREMQGMTPPDESGAWSLPDADPEEARLVLDVVADVFQSTQGSIWPSKSHVAEIARLRKAVPDIPPLWAHQVAQAYQLCAAQARDSRYLDFALGARPWESVERADWFARLLGKPLPAESRGVHGDSLLALLRLITYKGSLEDMQVRLRDCSRDPVPPPRRPAKQLTDGMAAASRRHLEAIAARAHPDDGTGMVYDSRGRITEITGRDT
jgi:hypothetical protein